MSGKKAEKQYVTIHESLNRYSQNVSRSPHRPDWAVSSRYPPHAPALYKLPFFTDPRQAIVKIIATYEAGFVLSVGLSPINW